MAANKVTFDETPERGSEAYRLGRMQGELNAIKQTAEASSSLLNKALTDLRVEVNRYSTDLRAEIREQKRDLEAEIAKHRLELQEQFRAVQTENKATVQQLMRWMYLIMGGATVAWFFLSHFADKLWKP